MSAASGQCLRLPVVLRVWAHGGVSSREVCTQRSVAAEYLGSSGVLIGVAVSILWHSGWNGGRTAGLSNPSNALRLRTTREHSDHQYDWHGGCTGGLPAKVQTETAGQLTALSGLCSGDAVFTCLLPGHCIWSADEQSLSKMAAHALDCPFPRVHPVPNSQNVTATQRSPTVP